MVNDPVSGHTENPGTYSDTLPLKIINRLDDFFKNRAGEVLGYMYIRYSFKDEIIDLLVIRSVYLVKILVCKLLLSEYPFLLLLS